jgi:hypothetical protein
MEFRMQEIGSAGSMYSGESAPPHGIDVRKVAIEAAGIGVWDARAAAPSNSPRQYPHAFRPGARSRLRRSSG